MFSKTGVFLSKLCAFAFITLLVFSGCENLFGEDEDEEDGALTVTVTDIVTSSDYGVAGVFPAGADAETTTPIAAGYKALSSSSVTVTARLVDSSGNLTSTTWTGSGGTSYDLYVFTKNSEPSNAGTVKPESGDDTYTTFPITYKQDGDVNLVLSGNDFVAY
jgi:hypothetical protein